MNQDSRPDKRLVSADILKVLSIIAVVCIHGSGLISFFPSAIDFSQEQIGLAENSLRFCVPVFIFFWAYFMEKSILKRGTGIIPSRFYRLLIPFAFWSLIYCVIKADIRHTNLVTLFLKHWTGYGWSGQYYFVILFQFIVLFPLWRRISIKLMRFTPAIYLISLLFFILIAYSGWSQIRLVVRINDRIFIYWWPYVILGIIHAHKNIFKFYIPPFLKWMSVILIPLEVYWFNPATVSPYALPSVFITSLLLISVMESKLTYQALQPWMASLIQRIANYTLGIYCLNPLIILILIPYFNRVCLQFPGSSVIIPLLSTSLVFSLCLVVITLLKKVKLGFLVST